MTNALTRAAAADAVSEPDEPRFESPLETAGDVAIEGRLDGALLGALSADDLSTYSIHELERRVARLEAEIGRCRDLIAAKQGARADADAVFKS